jgi:hypothetical protein
VDFPAATTIGKEAFLKCNALTTVTLPAATTIGKEAFYGCTALTTVNLPAAKTLGERAFYDCTALTTVNLPAVTSLGNYTFHYCTALTTVNLPAVTNLNHNPFWETGSRELTVTLGRNAPSIVYSHGTLYIEVSKTVIVKRPAGNTGYDAAWQDSFKGSFGIYTAVTLVFQDF